MSKRTHSIAIRGWIALAFAFLALLVPIVLNGAGLAKYDLERSGDDPYRPADRSVGERICLVSEWMVPACLLAWAAAQFRVRKAVLFDAESKGGRLLPVACGVAGFVLLAAKWKGWGPYTGLPFGTFQGWQFGLGWFLVWWGVVFVRLRAAEERNFPSTYAGADRP